MNSDMFQDYMDALSNQWQNERAAEQMTLGEAILILGAVNPGMVVKGVSDKARSYRGYYSDLAIEPGETRVGDLLDVLKDSLGKTFTGYKGGDFVMKKNTPLWVANSGVCGDKLMAFEDRDGVLYVATEPDEF